MSRPERVRERIATVLWWAAGVFAFWSCGYAVRRADDLWWHVAAGRWMLAEGTITRRDPFSFTVAGAPWLNDAWLADLIFAAWERVFGFDTLVWWKWALVVATFLVLCAAVRRLVPSEARPAAALAAFAAATLGAVTAGPFLDIRPQLYTFLGVSLVAAGTLGRPAPARALPLLFLVWANLHAGFIFGLACLGLLALPAVLRGGPPRRRALALGVLCLGACLLNPYGPAALTRPLRYLLDPSSPFHDLVEWWPPFRPGGVESPLYPWAIGAAAVAAALAIAHPALRRRDATWTAAALAAATLAMSLTSRRFVPLFAVTQALVVGPALALVLTPVLRRLPAWLPAAAALALGAWWLAPYPRAPYAFHYLSAEDHFPVEVMSFAEANALAGPVFAQYGWGGYVAMRSGGRMPVFVDGRADAVYPDAVFRRYQRTAAGAADWQTVIEESGAVWVLWPRHLPWGALPRALLATGSWLRVYEDAVAVLLRRAGTGPAGPYRPTPPSGFRSFALGALALERGDLAAARAALEDALARAPHLRRACNALAVVEARAGDVAAGWRTIARCQTIFPLPDRERWFGEQLARSAAPTP